MLNNELSWVMGQSIQNEEILMSKMAYITKIKQEFNRGQVVALKKIGKTDKEITEILGLNENMVKSLKWQNM